MQIIKRLEKDFINECEYSIQIHMCVSMKEMQIKIIMKEFFNVVDYLEVSTLIIP